MRYFNRRFDFEFFLAELRKLREVNRIGVDGVHGAPFLGEEIVQEFFSLHLCNITELHSVTEKDRGVL
jgi:hypothetical protein